MSSKVLSYSLNFRTSRSIVIQIMSRCGKMVMNVSMRFFTALLDTNSRVIVRISKIIMRHRKTVNNKFVYSHVHMNAKSSTRRTLIFCLRFLKFLCHETRQKCVNITFTKQNPNTLLIEHYRLTHDAKDIE